MNHYKHKKIKPLRLIAACLRGIASLLSVWPLLLVAAIIVSPISPHMRWSYQYRDFSPEYRIYYSCEYIGARGVVKYMRGDDCPFITLIDRR